MNIRNIIFKYRSDIILIIVIIGLAFLFSHNFAILKVSGSSMAPTYLDGQFILLKKHNTISKGDLIIFNAPEAWQSGKLGLLKRVVGKPNDKILINNENIVVNNVVEPHGKTGCENIYNYLEIKLYENEFLVAGDNKKNSNDGLYNYCIGIDDYKINKEHIIMVGKSIYVIGGFK